MTYLFEIILAALICGLLTKVSPSVSGKTNHYIKYVATLAFLVVILTPFIGNKDVKQDIFSNLNSIGNVSIKSEGSEDNHQYSNLEILSNEICKATVQSAAKYFNVGEEDFRIKIITADNKKEEFYIKEITVYPKGNALKINTSSMQKYFESIFKSPTEVHIKIE